MKSLSTTRSWVSLTPKPHVIVRLPKAQRYRLLAWLLMAALLAGCGQLETSFPYGPTTPIVLEASATVSVTPIPVELTPTPLPTQPPSETPAPIPSQASPTQDVIAHLDVGQAVTIVRLDMLDEQNGWAQGGLAGETEHILRTTNGGLTWQDVTPPQTTLNLAQPLQSAANFRDTQLAWVFYMQADSTPSQPAVIWRTQDGGTNWQASQPLDLQGLESQFYVSDLQFIDAQIGWLMAHVGVGMNHDYIMLYHTQDSGLSWQRLIDPYMDGGIQSCYKPGMLFSDEQHGWLPVNCNGVMPGAILYHTMDGGSTWETVNVPPPTDLPTLFDNPEVACSVADVTFFSPSYGKLSMTCANYGTDPLTYLYYLYTTQDGGATWDSTAYPGGNLEFLNDQLGWTQNWDIYQTTDGGTSWTKISTVSWQADFNFVSENLGWAVVSTGEEIALVKSEDGGVYWTQIDSTVR